MKLRFCEGVKFVVEDNTGYLSRVYAGENFTVGGAGIDFLQLIDGQRTLDDIIEELLKIYGNAEPYTLVKDMQGFAEDLATNGLIETFRD